MTLTGLRVIAGPLPCFDCGALVVYARRANHGGVAPQRADTFPSIRDADSGTIHVCPLPDHRQPDPMTFQREST